MQTKHKLQHPGFLLQFCSGQSHARLSSYESDSGQDKFIN